MKTCRTCKTSLPLSSFFRDKNSVDRLSSQCRECNRIYREDPSRKISVLSKSCSKCYVEKSIDDFPRRKRSRDGHSEMCSICSNTRELEKYYSDADTRIARQKIRYRKNVEAFLLRAARARATKYGVPFDMTVSDIVIPDVCPILGIDIRVSDGMHGPGSPSLDRMIPELGYVHGNVHVISMRANRIKTNSNLTEVELLFKWMKKNFRSL